MSSVALAIDIGGTKVETAFVDERGGVVPGTRFRRPTGSTATAEELWASTSDAVRATLAERGTHDLAGIGIGAAGPIDIHAGTTSALNLPAWRGFPLVDRISELVPGQRVVFRMDGTAITLAEHWVGAARGYDSVMGMIVSTGVGGGILVHGRPILGSAGAAPHVGHVEVGGFGDVPCVCGGHSCVEAIASGPRTVAWAREQGWGGSSGEELAAAYAARDALAVAAVRRAGTALGRGVASLAAVIDLDVVVIGGGFSKVTPDLFGFVEEPLQERVLLPYVQRTRVVPSGLGDDGPLVGAAALVLHAPL